MDWIATAACVIGFLFNARKNILCWPFWLAGNGFWFLFGLQQHLYSVVVLNVLYTILNVYGWYCWHREKK